MEFGAADACGVLQSSCPTLVLHGTSDDVIPLASSEQLVRLFPFAQLQTLNDDHSLMASQDAIHSAVIQWLEL
jgi:pimeloyl-ACP methyl ester carboxylesterase